MSNYHRVEGKEGLVKDPNTGAVINVDQNAYKAAKQLKQRILQERQEKEHLRERVERLESIVEQFINKNE